MQTDLIGLPRISKAVPLNSLLHVPQLGWRKQFETQGESCPLRQAQPIVEFGLAVPSVQPLSTMGLDSFVLDSIRSLPEPLTVEPSHVEIPHPQPASHLHWPIR